MYFALRSGQEHRSLQYSQIELKEPADSTPYLLYTENFSKNNAGGIGGRKLKPKMKAAYCKTLASQIANVHYVQLFIGYNYRHIN